ncbi:YDG/SRA domain-containing protein [Chryseobacterium sp.]|uniref:YDG/SRA domain-containing protein n=1 Tax=Chryseobacterium sp. TaxID=1871047 RepID=UPI00333EAEFA
MSKPIIFGEIEGFQEGHLFKDRQEIMDNNFHRTLQAGIDGNKKVGASVIILSGGYEDDIDHGHEIIYTGAGGNDANTKKQIKDQSWDNTSNAALLVSMDQGLPVRVIRGYKHKSDYSPREGYKYAGLYSVIDAWEEIGKSGYKICRFLLRYSDFQVVSHSLQDFSATLKRRKETVILRIVRDTKIAVDIKKLYHFKCQVCGTRIPTKSGYYAEGAHIKPLGMPHDGEDCLDNILCLCPNHHVMFDKGMFSILDTYQLIGCETGKLIVDKNHRINATNLQYHRKVHGHE